jgi:hypothetical protein
MILLAEAALFLFIGYLVGQIAKRAEALNACIVAAVFVIMGFRNIGLPPVWFNILEAGVNLSACPQWVGSCHLIPLKLVDRRMPVPEEAYPCYFCALDWDTAPYGNAAGITSPVPQLAAPGASSAVRCRMLVQYRERTM